MKKALPAAATLTALALAAPAAPADAGVYGNQTGSMEASVYFQVVAGGVRQFYIENACGCGGVETRNGDDKSVSYQAKNTSFAADICWTTVHYHFNGSVWLARNYPDTGGKQRVGCAPGYIVRTDDINFTG
jgi:hypothetical protein